MDYIPIMLNVTDRKVVIIGGGEAAYKKARNLFSHCRDITVVATSFDPGFAGLDIRKIPMMIESPEQVDHLIENGSVVIIATDDPQLNQALEAICRDRDVLFNRIDDGHSPFIFPASFELNGVIVSVSTLGKSPSFTRFLRDTIKEDTEKYTVALPVLERLRNEIGIRDFQKKAEFFREILSKTEFWDLISENKFDQAFCFAMHYSKDEK